MSAFSTVKISKTKTKRLTDGEKIVEKFNLSAADAKVKFCNIRTSYGLYLKQLKTLPSGSERDVPREIQNRLTCSKISSSTPHFVCCDFPLASTTCVSFWHFRCPKCMQQSALRSLVIVYDDMETTLFAIVCDLRFAIRDRLRSYGNQP